MPARLSNGAPTVASRPRFELPALDLDFGNITDGTNIPPPPASPVQKVPTPPQTPPAGSKEIVAATTPPESPDKKKPSSISQNGNLAAGTKRSADEAPLSPAGSGRQGSLRRLFSRNVLNGGYPDGRSPSVGNISMANGPRPESRGAVSVMDGRKLKSGSDWFRRLRGGDSRRSSLVLDTVPVSVPNKPSGPPPPVIPEIVDLEKDEGGLGGDLFRNIK